MIMDENGIRRSNFPLQLLETKEQQQQQQQPGHAQTSSKTTPEPPKKPPPKRTSTKDRHTKAEPAVIAATGTGTIPANFTSLNISLRSSGSSMSASHLRNTYFNPNFTTQQLRMRSEWDQKNVLDDSSQQQRRVIFPGVALSSEDSLNFPGSSNTSLNAFLQAKQEIREASVNVAETADASIPKRRRSEQQESPQNQMGNYLIQSNSSSIPASHNPMPTTFWMVTNPGNQVIGGSSAGDSMWTFPSSTNTNMYRGTMSSGVHFMNFATPMALLPGQQFGSVTDTHLGMLASLNAYRPIPGTNVSESPASGSHQHHGGENRHDSTS
ncbi:HVA22-like protein a [Hibiscus syriacus]|uniref:HVA22-like protein a n=1 Tax=Hibiscus syriacus TaxID=106335 RepID=A0A6A2X7T2_HIBSY|nr:HVA22-like protein a [Hibiscus syriacus]